MHLYYGFLQESEQILNAFRYADVNINRNWDREYSFRFCQEMSIIRLHDAWGRFCRELIVLSAGGKPFTSNGVRLPRAPGIKRTTDVIPTLISTYRNRTYEPRWAVASECIDAAKRLKVANELDIAGAVGANTSPIDEIRLVRNFLAHRNRQSAELIRRQHWYRLGTKLDVGNLAARKTTGGLTLMEIWILRLRLVGAAAIA